MQHSSDESCFNNVLTTNYTSKQKQQLQLEKSIYIESSPGLGWVLQYENKVQGG